MQSYNIQIKRLIIGKIIGAFFGICAIIATAYFLPYSSTKFKVGLFIWYSLFGHVIANSINAKEYLEAMCKINIPWYITCIIVGTAFGLCLSLLVEKKIHLIVLAFSDGGLHSAYWVVLDSICAALVTGFILQTYCKPTKNI